MSSFVGLYVDVDCLPNELADANWCCAHDICEAILKLEILEFESVSINSAIEFHVGEKTLTAHDLLMWLEDRKINKLYVPAVIKTHIT